MRQKYTDTNDRRGAPGSPKKLMFFDGVVKECSACGHKKNVKENFGKSSNATFDPARSGYWRARCNDCHNSQASEYQRNKNLPHSVKMNDQ